MAEIKRNFGIFWENSTLYCVETGGAEARRMFQIPFQVEEGEDSEAGGLSLSSENIRYIQASLQQHHVTTQAVNLSLPTKDIIFRSFVIPWMQSHEVEGVVKFESVKYIPFSLDDLVYTYHPLSVIEDGVRRIRIIFVAIKKSILESYIKALRQLGLNIIKAEPAALSLIRVLVFKGIIPQDQTVALISQEGGMGMIIVAAQSIPQFVREFPLTPNLPDHEQQEGNLVELQRRKFINEIRISLDYFNRQNVQLQIKQIVLLDLTSTEDTSKILEDDFDVPVVTVDDKSIFPSQEGKESGFVSAYGAGIIEAVEFPVDFNFIREGDSVFGSSAAHPKRAFHYKKIALAAGLGLSLTVGSVVLSQFLSHRAQQEIDRLKAELGDFARSSEDFLQTKTMALEKKVKNLKNIRRNTHAAFFLAAVGDMLPDGVWLKTLDISYQAPRQKLSKRKRAKKTSVTRKKDRPIIRMEGYVYLKESRDQFRLVNEVLQNLKNHRIFSGLFDEIKLETSKTEEIEGHMVTAFSIRCQ